MAIYRSPGAYAEEIQRTVAPSPIPNENIIALVSEVPDGTREEEMLELTGLQDVILAKKGIDTTSLRVMSRDRSTVYDVGSHYNVTQNHINPYLADTLVSRINQRITGETFTLDSGNQSYTLLNPKGAHDITVSAVIGLETVQYSQYTDYVFDRLSGRITRLASGTMPDNGTAITVDYSYGIEDGETVVLQYTYADPDYYSQKLFSDYNEIITYYGAPFAADGTPNPLSLAAQMIFANGGAQTEILTVPVNPHASDPAKTVPNLADWQLAVETLEETQYDFSLIVETSGLSDIHSYLINHVSDLLFYTRARVAILGRDGTKEALSKTELRSYSSAINNERVVMVSEPEWELLNSSTGGLYRVGGQYAAAAFAGLLTRLNVQESTTRKGLTGCRTLLQRSDQSMDRDTTSGLLVVENRQGFMRIRHGTSTMYSNINSREINVVRAKDFIIRSLRDVMDGAIVGRLMQPDIELVASHVATAILERMKQSHTLAEYTQPQVYQNEQNPTRLDVRFTYLPNYAVNEVVIQFAISPVGTVGTATTLA